LVQKLEGVKTILWTGLLVAISSVLIVYFQPYWESKLSIISQVFYGTIAVGILFSAQFSRSRITILLLLMLSFYLTKQEVIFSGNSFSLDEEYLFITGVFIFGFLASVKDRGLFSIHGVVRFAGISLCFLLTKVWLLCIEQLVAYSEKLPISPSMIEQCAVNIPLYCVALYILYKSIKESNLFTSTLLANLVLANLIYQQQLILPLAVILSFLTVQYMLVVVIDSYYLAYRDELTNLPSRRALNQFALSLGRKYCVAMLDVDHFKKFNDNYGHDIGDQVLRLVGSKLSKIKGGGRVFRYGGEEFTAIFPRKNADEVKDELEKLRQSIADYKIVIRHPIRKNKKSRKEKNNSEFRDANVTISIGVANRENKESFEETVKQADLALYRAKKKGRNNVSF